MYIGVRNRSGNNNLSRNSRITDDVRKNIEKEIKKQKSALTKHRKQLSELNSSLSSVTSTTSEFSEQQEVEYNIFQTEGTILFYEIQRYCLL